MPDPLIQAVWNETAGADVELSATIDLSPGNTVVLGFQGGSSLAGFGGMSQTDGDALVGIIDHDNAGNLQRWYIAEAVAGGSTLFRLAWGNAQPAGMFVLELAGLTASPVDQSATQNFTSGSSCSSGTTGALADAIELAIAMFNLDGSGTTNFTSLTNGFAAPANGNQIGSGHTGARAFLCSKVTAATDPVETTLNTDGAIYIASVVTFKLAGTGGGKPAGYYARQRGA
jgi:hypothetical protein